MLKAISFGFNATEDRMVLKLHLSEPDGEVERNLLLTRRVCSTWSNDLRAMLDLVQAEPQSIYSAPASGSRKAAVAKVRQDARSLSNPSPEAVPNSGNSAPVLVLRVICARRRSDGRWVMRFLLRDEPTVTLMLVDKALRQFDELLRKRLNGARWDLPAHSKSGVDPKREPPRSLH